MKELLGRIKKYKLLVIGIIIGGVIFGGGVYASTIGATNVSYSNATSGIAANNVQKAVDTLYTKAKDAEQKCPDGYICTKPSFKDDSWLTIASNVKVGKASAYQVGDTKTVDMGSLGTHTVRVANTSSCTNGETSQTACGFVVEFADIITEQKMNSSDTNVGGWPASSMRTYVNGTIYNALPGELQNVIATTTVVSGHGKSDSSNFTSTDKLYLLSTKEVWGKDGTSGVIKYDTAETETRQLDYYKNKGVTTSNYSGAIKQYNGSNSYWWLRSARSDYTYIFFSVHSSGGWGNDIANNAHGVSPAFRIA